MGAAVCCNRFGLAVYLYILQLASNVEQGWEEFSKYSPVHYLPATWGERLCKPFIKVKNSVVFTHVLNPEASITAEAYNKRRLGRNFASQSRQAILPYSARRTSHFSPSSLRPDEGEVKWVH
jgi:hypothetical protein